MSKKSFDISHMIFMILPHVLLAAGYVLTILSFSLHGKAVILADDSTEWILAEHLNRTGTFISRDWTYGTELHVFFTQILNKPLLHLIHDWHLAHTVSLAICMAILVLCVLALGRVLHLSRYAAWAAVAFVFPFGTRYRYFGLFSGFYLFYFILLFGNLVLVFLAQDKIGKHRKILTALSLALSFLAGLNGIRHLIIFGIPLFLTTALLTWLQLKNTVPTLRYLLHHTAPVSLLAATLHVIACAAGWMVNERILSRIYTFWTYRNNNLETFRFSDFLDYFDSAIYLWGYEGIYDFSSSGGFGQLFSLILVTILIGCLIYCLCNRERLHILQSYYVCFALIAYVSNALIFYFGQQAEDRFLLFSACLIFPVVAITILQMKEQDAFRSGIVALGFTLCLLMQSVGLDYLPAFVTQRAPSPQENVTAFLLENGYTQGIAHFWNSANITYLSNGAIDMWACVPTVSESSGHTLLTVRNWESETAKASRLPQGKTFFLTHEEDDEDYGALLHDKAPVYDAEGYQVYAFDHVSTLFP